ncbi:hypothetical protein Tco_1169493 [Tanacetum coccineum]
MTLHLMILRCVEACFSAEVSLRSDHNYRERKKFERRCQRQGDLLKEKDTEIANLKAQLSLKEAEAAEAIRLRSQVASIKGTEAARVNELNSLKERTTILESTAIIKDTELASFNAQITKLAQDLSNFQLSYDMLSIKAASLKYEKDKLTDQVSSLETTCSELPGRRWILGRDIRLVVMKCLQSLKYLAALGGAIGRAIDKGMQDGLAAGIDHERAGRGLVDVAAYNPSAEANYVSDVNTLRLLHLEGTAAETPKASQLQPSHEQLMLPIHRTEDEVVIGETSLSFSLDVVYARVQRIRGDAAS